MIVSSEFKPAWWLPGGHAQTLWANFARGRTRIALRRERLELPDGDFLDLDWTAGENGPIVIIFHGLEGSSRSHYARALMCAMQGRGWRGVVVHSRGCSGEPNRLPRSYHAEAIDDVETVVAAVRTREPHTPLAAVGYSLGGSALLNWLGRRPDVTLHGAVAVSVPFDLFDAAARLDRGFSRLYQWRLLALLRRATRAKFRRIAPPFDLQKLTRLRNFRQFDDAVTAPINGFAGVDDYYTRASCRPHLCHIKTPVLLLHALDDPFMTPASVPHADELSHSVRLEISRTGGHVGFVGGTPWHCRYWLDERIPEFLKEVFSR